MTQTITYTGNTYPEVKFPTQGDSNAINVNLASISTTQSTTSSSNRNQISAESVALKAASERHQNAIKAITNLLAIIDQARANRLKAQTDVEYYNKKYIEAQGTQRKTQETIITYQTKIQQITSAINGLSTKIEGITTDIAKLNNERSILITEIG